MDQMSPLLSGPEPGTPYFPQAWFFLLSATSLKDDGVVDRN